MQLSYNDNPGMGRAGMLAEASLVKRTISRLARGPIAAGRMAFIVPGIGAPGTPPNPNPGTVYQNPSPAAAADVDAIVATGLSTTGTDTVDDADGVHGAEDLFPPRRLVVTFGASTDWDPTVGVITYVNHLGQTVTENVAIATSTAVTTTGYALRFVSFQKPAQTGATGTYTIGVPVLDSSLTAADFSGVALYDSATVESTYGVDTRTEEYVDGATVPLLRVGPVWVVTEDACAEGGAVYVRTAAGAGGSELGAFRSDADTASAVLHPTARWGRTSLAGGLNILELGQ